MRLLVTGSDGFIGGTLFRDLREAGHAVLGTCFLRAAADDEVCLDLSDAESFRKLPDIRFDAVIHAAGIVDQRTGRTRMRAVNAEGTGRLVRWAQERGVPHFVFLSSTSVYGLRTLGRNRTEASTRRTRGVPAVPYMGAKARAERLGERSGQPYTILRLPAVLGRGDSYLSPTIISALQDGSYFSSGAGDRMVSLMCAANLGAVIRGVLQKGPANRAFNCCDAHVAWNDLVGEYARRLGVGIPRRKRSALSMLFHMGDKRYLLLLTFSRFGMHSPDDLLHAWLPHDHKHSWRAVVAHAVAGRGSASAAS